MENPSFWALFLETGDPVAYLLYLILIHLNTLNYIYLMF